VNRGPTVFPGLKSDSTLFSDESFHLQIFKPSISRTPVRFLIFRRIFSPADIQTVYFQDSTHDSLPSWLHIIWESTAFEAWLTKQPVLEVLVYFVQRDEQCNSCSAMKHQTLGVVYQTRYIAMQPRATPQQAQTAPGQSFLILRFRDQQSLK
jgi:hypothetical protein